MTHLLKLKPMESSAQSDKLPNLSDSTHFHSIKNPAFRRIGLMGRARKRGLLLLFMR